MAKINRLLIFGTGFLAAHFIEHLKDSGKKSTEVKVVFNKHKIEVVEGAYEHVKMESENLETFLEAYCPTHVLCLHGNSFVPASLNVRDTMEDNSLKTMVFLESLLRSVGRDSIDKVLVVGSASEYGKYYNEAISESYPLHATSMYGLSKISLYNASKYYYDRGLPLVHIRQFNTIGPGQRGSFVLPSFCRQVIEIEKGLRSDSEIHVGDLSQERDFIDVRDTCRAYSLLFNRGVAGEVYNVASGQFIKISDLLDMVISVASVNKKIKVVKDKDLFSDRDQLSRRLHGSIAKLENLGFKAEISIEKTIQDTLEYWRHNV